jgi:hypothetical protein
MKRPYWLLSTLLLAGAARAQDFEPSVELHGFVSQGYLKSTGNNYIAPRTRSLQGSPQFFEAALNGTATMTDQLRAGLQLRSFDFGRDGNFAVALDWAFLDYKAHDALGVRAGRFKMPIGLYTEVWDIDLARVPVLLPQAVYSNGNRDTLLASSGIEVYGRVGLGQLGALEYEAHTGAPNVPNEPNLTYDVRWSAGGRLTWETPLDGLRASASTLVGAFNITNALDPFTSAQLIGGGLVPADFDGEVRVRANDYRSYFASLELRSGDLLVAAEYSRTTYVAESSLPAVVGDDETAQDGFYVLATYRATDWLTAGAYGSFYFPNFEDRGNDDDTFSDDAFAHSYDYALTLRFDLTSFWALKVESHYIDGKASVPSWLNPDIATSPDTWWLFAAKTTLAF